MTDQEQNNSAQGVVRSENMDLLIAQYNALREEMVKRVEVEYQLIALTLTASGIILTVGLQTNNALVLLIYPILALFLSAAWINNVISIDNIGTYIREHIEPRAAENTIGWEHKGSQTWEGLEIVTAVGSRAIFSATGLLAMLAGLSLATFNVTEKVLLALDVLSILLIIVLFILSVIRWRKDKPIPFR